MAKEFLRTSDGTLVNPNFIATVRPMDAFDARVDFYATMSNGQAYTIPIETPQAAARNAAARDRKETIESATKPDASTPSQAGDRSTAPSSLAGSVMEAATILEAAVTMDDASYIQRHVASVGPVLDVHK